MYHLLMYLAKKLHAAQNTVPNWGRAFVSWRIHACLCLYFSRHPSKRAGLICRHGESFCLLGLLMSIIFVFVFAFFPCLFVLVKAFVIFKGKVPSPGRRD